MTYETKIENPAEPQSWWQRLRDRLNAFSDALDYDPQEQLYNAVRDLSQRVAELERR